MGETFRIEMEIAGTFGTDWLAFADQFNTCAAAIVKVVKLRIEDADYADARFRVMRLKRNASGSPVWTFDTLVDVHK